MNYSEYIELYRESINTPVLRREWEHTHNSPDFNFAHLYFTFCHREVDSEVGYKENLRYYGSSDYQYHAKEMDLDGLVIWSQFDPTHPEPYATGLVYQHCHHIDGERDNRMAKTLNIINRKLDSWYKKYGNPATFGDTVQRVMRAAGIDRLYLTAGSGDCIGLHAVVAQVNCDTQLILDCLKEGKRVQL